DAGTRVCRFMVQDILGAVAPSLGQTKSVAGNLIATLLSVGAWGYFLYQGVVDPFGGINTLWPLFGIANQMLAAIALTLVTVLIGRSGATKYVWVSGIPLVWLLACTLTAAVQKIWHSDTAIGFLAHAAMLQKGVDAGTVLGPAKSLDQMRQIVLNDQICAG